MRPEIGESEPPATRTDGHLNGERRVLTCASTATTRSRMGTADRSGIIGSMRLGALVAIGLLCSAGAAESRSRPAHGEHMTGEFTSTL